MTVLHAINDENGQSYEQRRIAELEARIAALTAAQGRLSLKVSKNGAVSIYGMGRWPVTLYRSQMERLLDGADQIRAFINTHAHELAVKGETP